MICKIDICQEKALFEKEYCRKHFIEVKEEEFLNNTDWDNLGICKWLKYFYLEHYRDRFSKQHIEFYKMLLELYDSRYTNKMHRLREVIAFRGFAKSKVIFGISSYIIMHNGMKMKIKALDGIESTVKIDEKFLVIFSETGGMAEDFVVNIRDEMSTNSKLKFFYRYTISDAKEEDTGQWTRKAFKINGMFILGLGAGQQARGKIRGAYRPTFVCHKLGSEVWHKNHLVKIENTDWKKKEIEAKCLEIKLNGIPNNEIITLEHEYWVKERIVTRNKKGDYFYSFGKPKWQKASELTLNSYIGMPILYKEIPIPKFNGWIDKKNNQIRITSINYEALLVLSYMLARLNIPSSIRKGASPRIEKFNVNGRKYTSLSKQKYDIMFNPNCKWINKNIKSSKRINSKAIIIENGWIWRRVHSIAEAGYHKVIQVNVPNGEGLLDSEKENHTYLTPFGKSHNCYDDLYSENNTKTEQTRNGIKNWFYNAAQHSVDDLLGKALLVGTIVHDDTVIVECEKSKLWKTLKFYPMNEKDFKRFIKENLKVNLDRNWCELPFENEQDEFKRIEEQTIYFKELESKEDWGLSWSDRLGLYQLSLKYKEAVENRAVAGFYQEYFHITMPSELRKFNPEYFKDIPEGWVISYEYGYTWLECKELYSEKEIINIEFGLDLASGLKEGDNVAIIVYGITSDGKSFILENKYGKFSMRDNINTNDVRIDRIILDREYVSKIGYIDETFRLALEYHPRIIKVGTGGGLESSVVTEMQRIFRMNQNYTIIIPRVQSSRNGTKEERIRETLLPKYETMSVYHRKGLTQLEYELEFLGKASQDDQADALEVSAYNAYRPSDIKYSMFNQEVKKKVFRLGYERNKQSNWLEDWRIN